jgi:uncharacterized membrane protein YfcA
MVVASRLPQQQHRRRLAITSALLLVVCAALLPLASAAAASADPAAAAAAGPAAADPAAPSYPPWQWNWRTGVALAASVLISLVIAPGGSGGAQLYYPLFTVLLGFSVRDTAAVVSFVMLCGAVISCTMAVVERHPTQPETRTLIDFGSVLVVAPAVLLGVAGGVVLNAILPLWLLQAASVSVFMWAFIKIGGSLQQLRAKEQERLQAARALAAGVAEAAAEEDKMRHKAGAADVEGGGGNSKGGATAADSTSPFAAHATEATAAATATPATAAAAATTLLLRARSSGSGVLLSTALTQRLSQDLARLASLDEEVAALGAAGGLMEPAVMAAAAATVEEGDEEQEGAEEEAQKRFERACDAAAAAAGKAEAPAPASSTRTPFAQRLRRWARRQPGMLILLTLLVLVQQLVFSILQRSVVAACSPAWYGVWAARIAVTIAIAVGAGVVVSRFNARFAAEQEANGTHVAAPAFVVVVAPGAPKEEEQQQDKQAQPSSGGTTWRARRASRRAERRACKQERLSKNHDAIQWRVQDMLQMNAAMLAIGVLGGTLGLGGGFAIAPLLLALGLAPQPQTATSKVILLISTLASSASFLIAGRMPLTHALVFGGINMIVTPLGIVAINALIRRTGRPSILVFLNALSYAAGVVLLLSMSAIPGWIATAQGRVPAGFDLEGFCPS